jgi:hypothetical protein
VGPQVGQRSHNRVLRPLHPAHDGGQRRLEAAGAVVDQPR